MFKVVKNPEKKYFIAKINENLFSMLAFPIIVFSLVLLYFFPLSVAQISLKDAILIDHQQLRQKIF